MPAISASHYVRREISNPQQDSRRFSRTAGELVYGWASPSPPSRLSLPEKPSIAVLPFQNMRADPEQEYFADGMAEEITTGLAGIKGLS